MMVMVMEDEECSLRMRILMFREPPGVGGVGWRSTWWRGCPTSRRSGRGRSESRWSALTASGLDSHPLSFGNVLSFRQEGVVVEQMKREVNLDKYDG